MKAMEPAEASALFERCFADGDLDGLMSLYEEGAVFPTPHGTSTGHEQIRATLKAYLDSGATAEVVRRQADGSWKYVIDNPDGSALLGHE